MGNSAPDKLDDLPEVRRMYLFHKILFAIGLICILIFILSRLG